MRRTDRPATVSRRRLVALAGTSCLLTACGSIARPTVDRARAYTTTPATATPTSAAPAVATPAVTVVPPASADEPLARLGKAPPIDLPVWINSAPISLASLQDNAAVVVAFWSFTNVACQQDVPFLINLYEQYQREDFRLIAVHSPEFEFQKDVARVRDHVSRLKIPYPVAVDNDLDVWNAYGARLRPSYYGVDWYGNVRFVRAGPNLAGALHEAVDPLLLVEYPPAGTPEAGGPG